MSESETFRPLPLVQVAAFCHTTLQEQNGAISLIRVTDRIMVGGTTPEMLPTPIQNLTLVVILKSGFMRGRYNVKIRPETPSAQHLPELEWPVLFEGEERGVGLVTPMSLMAKEEGLYWFDVSVENTLLTRIPLRVLYQRSPQFGISPTTPQP